MVDSIAIRVEAYRDTLVIETQQLIHGTIACFWVFVRGEDAVPFDKAKVVTVAIDPEASRVAMVVDGRDLRLDGTGEVLILVVSLSIRIGDSIAFVRMARSTATEVSGDDAVVVDTEQLVKGRVGVVVESRERILPQSLEMTGLECAGTGSDGEHENT